jgi:uncharacterized cupin superfamily protein
MVDTKQFVLQAAEIAQREQSFSHPWNPKSQLIGVQLSRVLGLKRAAVSIARMPPGKESFVYHSHQHEEEWLYILSGRGIAEIDGEEIEVGPGDFMAFPTPSVPHQLKNPFEEELLYLMGGENREFDVADFPRLAKRMVKSGEKFEVYDVSNAKPFGPLDT